MSVGELFSRVYLNRGQAAPDSVRFRRRLFGYMHTVHGAGQAGSWWDVGQFFSLEGASTTRNAMNTSGGHPMRGTGSNS